MNQKLNCILVIDDDEPTNFFTNMMLEESGCAEHIIILQSGQEALEYLRKSDEGNNPVLYPSPDLILLDINMPAMDGWEFLENYKKADIKNKIIVVMLTTSLFPEDRLKARQMPEVSGFENKPLTPGKIAAVLEKCFPNVLAQ